MRNSIYKGQASLALSGNGQTLLTSKPLLVASWADSRWGNVKIACLYVVPGAYFLSRTGMANTYIHLRRRGQHKT